MAAMAKAKLPAGLNLDGIDIAPVLFEGEKLPVRTVFWRTKGQAAVRTGPWKLLMRSKKRTGYEFVGLYNLDEDIGEENNLAQAKAQMVEAFKAKLSLWEEDVTAGVKWIRR
jgi:arylsulfatase A-like enzyme